MALKFSVNFDNVRRRKVERLLNDHIKELENTGAEKMTEQEKYDFKKLQFKKLKEKTKKGQ